MSSPLARAARLLARGDWNGAHSIVQDDESILGCWAHGIVHLMEGDLANARYWYRRARRPCSNEIDVPSEIDALTAAIERAGG